MAAPLVSDPGPSIPVGHRIGGYQVEAPLGAGGMGVVYRALDTKLNRPVAIKVLPPDAVADPAPNALASLDDAQLKDLKAILDKVAPR